MAGGELDRRPQVWDGRETDLKEVQEVTDSILWGEGEGGV